MGKKSIKLTKAQKQLREEYLQDKNNETIKVKVNLAGGLQKIGIGGAKDE